LELSYSVDAFLEHFVVMTPPSDTPFPPPSANGEQTGLAAGVTAILDALRRRWKTLAAITLVVMLAVLAVVMLITPQYVATARLRVEPTQGALVGQVPTGSNMPDQSIVETEASVMRSHDLAVQVVRKLNLAKDSEFTKDMPPLPANAAQADRDARIDDVADVVADNVSVSREKATYVIDLSFKSVDPSKAARLANAFADAYIESNLSRRAGTASRQAAMLQGRVRGLATAAQNADAQLAQYRASAGIVGEGAVSVTDQQISPLAGQVATAESEAAAARSKLAVAQRQVAGGGSTAVSAVLGSNVISNLRAQRATLVSQFSEISTRYGPRHPETLRVKEQLQAIDQQIQDEATRVIGGLQSDASAATARAASLRGELQRLKGAQAVETRSTVAADSYKRRADAAHQAYNQAAELAQRTNQIAANPLSQAQLVEGATIPQKPSAPNKKMLVIAGVGFALLLGCIAVAGQELLSSGLRTRGDMERLGVPLITAVPLQGKPRGRDRISPAESLVNAPFTAYAEAFRTIRSTLTIGSEQPIKVVAFVSSLPGEGKTTTSLSLARVMALSNERTLIIDCDTRRAGLGALLGAKADAGLVEVLRDGVSIDLAISRDVVGNLDFVTVTSASFVSADLFSGDRARDLIQTLRGRYDRIILDTPPLLGVADARAIAALADAVILVVRWEKTHANAVRSALEVLDRGQAPLIGSVYSMVDPNASVSGASYYSNRYAPYYQQG
jgi:succinoglycan biosynthesis transport protein ExoP